MESQLNILGYEVKIFWSDEDDAYIADAPDLPYTSAWGETYEEAAREIEVAIRLHLRVLKETGRPIPEPRPAPGREGQSPVGEREQT